MSICFSLEQDIFHKSLSLPEVLHGSMKHYFPTPPTQAVKPASSEGRVGVRIIISKTRVS